MMDKEDLVRRVQIKQPQLTDSRQQSQSTNFELKYKKALKQISGIIKANRQLKEQLIKLNNLKVTNYNTYNQINKDQLQKAFQKTLKQKNELLGQKQNMLLENQKLKYTIASLQETVTKLKNQQMDLAKKKQASKINSMQQSFSGNDNFKNKQPDKQIQMKKNLQNYEQRQISLTRINRKLEQQINQLQSKLYKIEQQYKNKLNEKDVELKLNKSTAREQYQNQVIALKRQISQLKMKNDELTAKLNQRNQSKNYEVRSNVDEEQLIQTLKELRQQMEPMSFQIAELQEKNEFEREEAQREKINLQIKVKEFQAEIQRIKDSHKLLEQRLLKETEKSRKADESQRNLRKLEEENRMLGGRVIVLQAREVALRNRPGDELQERIVEFQTRVKMLLHDKEAIANMKNPGIHQLLALKAYILQLDSRLKQAVSQNQYATKKYKTYKQKCTQFNKQLKHHEIAINTLKGKLQGYDRLVVKLQGELERSISINQSEIKAVNYRISEQTMTSVQIYKKRYQSLLDKWNLQQKYAEQEVQTLKLHYQTKILELNVKIQELASIRDTISLYKAKNEELSKKLTQKQSELLQTKMTKVLVTENGKSQAQNILKDTINKLNNTLNSKEDVIIGLESQLKKLQQEWKNKYSKLQHLMNMTISQKNRQQEDRKREISRLEEQIKTYKARISQFQCKLSPIPTTGIDDDEYSFKVQQFTSKITDLQLQVQDFKNKYQIESGKVQKLTRIITDIKNINRDLQSQISKLKHEINKIQNKMEIQLQQKDIDLKKIINREQQVQKRQSDNNNYKINSLIKDLEIAQSQIQHLEKEKTKNFNKMVGIQKQLLQRNTKIQELSYEFSQSKTKANKELMIYQQAKTQQIERLQTSLKSIKGNNTQLLAKIEEYENDRQKNKNDFNRQRQKLTSEIECRDEQISKIKRQLNKVRNNAANQEDVREEAKREGELLLQKLNNDICSLKNEIESQQNQIQGWQTQVRQMKSKQIQQTNKIQDHQNHVYQLTNDIKILQIKQIQLQTYLQQKQQKTYNLSNQLSSTKHQLKNIEQTLQTKQAMLTKLDNQILLIKQKLQNTQIALTTSEQQNTRLNSDITIKKQKIQDLQDQLQSLKLDITRFKSQNQINETNYFHLTSQIENKQLKMIKLESQIKFKLQHIKDLQAQITINNNKIIQLQNDVSKYKSILQQHQNQLIQKNQLVTKYLYQITDLKNKCQSLQEQKDNKNNNLTLLNKQLLNIRTQVRGYQDDICLKDMTIERYKNDVNQFNKQIQDLHQQTFDKTKTINNLKQQIFKITLQHTNEQSDKINTLQKQIYKLKSKIVYLQDQLNDKQNQLSKTKFQFNSTKSTISVKKYSDDQYQLIQAQFYQAQKSLLQCRNTLSDKQFQITQLQAKIQCIKKNQLDIKKRWNQQRNDLQQQIQTLKKRQRNLLTQIHELKSQLYLQVNRNQDYKINSNYQYKRQTNPMTFTFMEINQSNYKSKIKQYQLGQDKKSLVSFINSNDDITTISSRLGKNIVSTDRTQNQQYLQWTTDSNALKKIQNTHTPEISQNSNRSDPQSSNSPNIIEGNNKIKTEYDNILKNIQSSDGGDGVHEQEAKCPTFQPSDTQPSPQSLAEFKLNNNIQDDHHHARKNKQSQHNRRISADNNRLIFERNLHTVSSYSTSSHPFEIRNIDDDHYSIGQNPMISPISNQNIYFCGNYEIVDSIKQNHNGSLQQQKVIDSHNQQQTNQNLNSKQQQGKQSQQQKQQKKEQTQQSTHMKNQGQPQQTTLQKLPPQQTFPPQITIPQQQLTGSLNQKIQMQGHSWRYTPSPVQGETTKIAQIHQQQRASQKTIVNFGSNQNISTGKIINQVQANSFAGVPTPVPFPRVQISARPLSSCYPQSVTSKLNA